MNDSIFRKTLVWIMNTIAYNTKDTATVFMLLLAIWWGNELVNTDHVPIILAVLAIIFFYGPIFYLVSSVLLIIPKLVCLIILKLMEEKGNNWNRYYQKNYSQQQREGQYKQQYKTSGNSSDKADYSQDDKDSWKTYWEQAERKYQQQNSYSENQGNQKNYNQSGPNQQRKRDELQEALEFYGLTIPFTETVLREKRKKLIKEAHPDEGGSNEKAADINRYFDILKKFANK